jgi:hypothetical protein
VMTSKPRPVSVAEIARASPAAFSSFGTSV